MTQPIYKKIQAHILNKIASEEYQEGMQIPTELDLAKIFSVSRMTANRAVVELSQQGVLKRIPGKGTFVAPKKIAATPLKVTDISNEIKSRGHIHTWELREQRAMKAPPLVAKALEVSSEDSLYFCHLIHSENGMPIAMEKRYVNPKLVPDFFEADYLEITPSGFLLKSYRLTEMEHSIEAIIATAAVAQELQIAVGAPCLYITRRSWNEEGVITYVEFTFPAERYKLTARQLAES